MIQSLILIRKYSIKISARFRAGIFLNIEGLRQRIFLLSRGLLILKKTYGKNMKNFFIPFHDFSKEKYGARRKGAAKYTGKERHKIEIAFLGNGACIVSGKYRQTGQGCDER